MGKHLITIAVLVIGVTLPVGIQVMSQEEPVPAQVTKNYVENPNKPDISDCKTYWMYTDCNPG